ncbi:Uu.00g085810.m01.CDS01 [Anthostomella pinea]|uniref:Uu.00g085810.m01.CDS01 n=1 Tax=Anthostomella pinea TaxID=933095 RepID=A0AAI8YJU2_9PEZI|nr:Uu.00g085810.m01.CDS01 [Anthostomella pinea]
MPRLRPSFIRRAHNISSHLATLLPACRDLRSAQNELRWIREHVSSSLAPAHEHNVTSRSCVTKTAVAVIKKHLDTEVQIDRLCRLRGTRGVPLQYVLGSQPFGDLDIRCRPGVLIPRPETEAWVFHLADLVRNVIAEGALSRPGGDVDDRTARPLKIVDLCSGSGCIALLLSSLLRSHLRGSDVDIRGFDVEPRAVSLAKENLAYNLRRRVLPRPRAGRQNVVFEKADIFSEDWLASLHHDPADPNAGGSKLGAPIDIFVSNPPYISMRGYDCDTGRSVRNYEPRLALVPHESLRISSFADCAPEDVFYARLLEVAEILRPKFVVLEVGDLAQATRVLEMAVRAPRPWITMEVWRDWPDMAPEEGEDQVVRIGGLQVPVRGSGHGRTVFLQRGA